MHLQLKSVVRNKSELPRVFEFESKLTKYVFFRKAGFKFTKRSSDHLNNPLPVSNTQYIIHYL